VEHARRSLVGSRDVSPRQIPVEDLEKVAQGLARGHRQGQIAQDNGWTASRITRCLNLMRDALAQDSGEGAWLDTRKRTPYQVALEWILLRARSPTIAQ